MVVGSSGREMLLYLVNEFPAEQPFRDSPDNAKFLKLAWAVERLAEARCGRSVGIASSAGLQCGHISPAGAWPCPLTLH